MIFILSPSTDPAFNLALEQYVFDHMDRAEEYFILWQNKDTVVIGKNQNAFAEVHHKVAKEKNISVVRRLSGGGAVYHDLGNLNYTFILDAGNTAELDLHLFCRPITELLQRFGVPAEINGRNDIVIAGQKISGNAQYLRQGRIMHHGTLLFQSDLSVVSDVLHVSDDKFRSKAAKSVKSRVTNIAPFLKEPLSLEEFKTLAARYIMHTDSPQPYVFSSEELQAIQKIKEERYDTYQWNYGNSPAYSVVKKRYFENCGLLEIHMDCENGFIRSLQFYGDFFSLKDPALLAEALVGQPLERTSMEKFLQPYNISAYFHGLETESFLACLLESE